MDELEGTPKELHTYGMGLVSEGNYELAVHYFGTALERLREEGVPENAPEVAPYYLANGDALLRYYEDCVDELSPEDREQAEEAAQDFADAWDHFELARLGFESRIAKNKDDQEAGSLLILTHMRMGDHKQVDDDPEGAETEYAKSLELCGKFAVGAPKRHAEVLFPLGSVLQQSRKHDEALPIFKRALASLQEYLATIPDGPSGKEEHERFTELITEVENRICECQPAAVAEAAKAAAAVKALISTDTQIGFDAPRLAGPITVTTVKRKAASDAAPPAKAAK